MHIGNKHYYKISFNITLYRQLTSEELAQGTYMAAVVGFEPATLRMHGNELTTEPQRLERHTKRHTERHTEKHRERHTERHKERHAEGHTEIQRHIERQRDTDRHSGISSESIMSVPQLFRLFLGCTFQICSRYRSFVRVH